MTASRPYRFQSPPQWRRRLTMGDSSSASGTASSSSSNTVSAVTVGSPVQQVNVSPIAPLLSPDVNIPTQVTPPAPDLTTLNIPASSGSLPSDLSTVLPALNITPVSSNPITNLFNSIASKLSPSKPLSAGGGGSPGAITINPPKPGTTSTTATPTNITGNPMLILGAATAAVVLLAALASGGHHHSSGAPPRRRRRRR